MLISELTIRTLGMAFRYVTDSLLGLACLLTRVFTGGTSEHELELIQTQMANDTEANAVGSRSKKLSTINDSRSVDRAI